MSSPIITPVSDPNLSGVVRLEAVLQQMADHKGCGTTSGDSGKASCGTSAGDNADLPGYVPEQIKPQHEERCDEVDEEHDGRGRFAH